MTQLVKQPKDLCEGGYGEVCQFSLKSRAIQRMK